MSLLAPIIFHCLLARSVKLVFFSYGGDIFSLGDGSILVGDGFFYPM